MGMEGACIYKGMRNVRRDIGQIDLEAMRLDPKSKDLDMGKMLSMVGGIAQDDLLFLKIGDYSHQNEYRMLWLTTTPAPDFIDVVCPEARTFCTRFDEID